MLCDPIPLFVGIFKNKVELGVGGFFATTLAGVIEDLLLTIPASGLFVWLMLKKVNEEKKQQKLKPERFHGCRYINGVAIF